MRDKIVINAIGGLCNRMRAIAAAYTLARISHRSLHVVWRRNDELGADFIDLFQPLPAPLTLITPTSAQYHLQWENPRKKNLYLSALHQHLSYRKVYSDGGNLMAYAGHDARLRDEIASLTGNILIISGLGIGGYDPADLRTLFRPSQAVQTLIDTRTTHFDPHTIGVHIRRTDNRMAIRQSPLRLFSDEMQRLLQADPATRFFLATDDATVMHTLAERFGHSVICGDDNPNRHTRQGMLHAAADLWALSLTSRIIGSYYSSYTDLASQLGGIPLKILTSTP